jgi:serine/threonine-protein kinase
VTTASPAEQLVGAVLNGRFRLVRLLGEGGMGAVYEAEGINGEGKFAIKLLHQEFVREEQVLSRFFAEAQTTRALQHPNVTRIFETASAENGTPYLVMELLQGTPLATYVDNGQALPPAQAVNIVFGVLQALAMAHQRGVVHRDLKPDNLFLVPDANGVPNVKVLDFGIAKVMDVAGGMGQKTRTGVLLGTPGYMSPEQVKNSKAVDPRSDLWSVAVILYELLTGVPPFPGDNEFARLTSVLSEEPKPIAQVAPHLASWAPFFQRALAKEPAQRFQSADEMGQAVLATARGVSMRPPPPPTLQGGGAGDYRPSAVSMPYAAILGSAVQQQSGLMPSPAMMQGPMSQQSGLMPSPAYGPMSQAAPMSAAQMAAQPTYPSTGGTTAMAQAPVSTPLPPPIESSGIMAAPLSAMAAISAPTSRPNATIASQPPPSLPSHVSAGVAVGPTHVSQQRPAGTPTVQDAKPSIAIVDAPPRPGVAYWVVGVVAFVALGLGFVIGYVVH